MRAGLSAIQQTLTPDAASVLNLAIAEATRRNHGQTTPLHVAATLLASPSGFLRQACIKSHPNSSHPLQCRALELCFSVALERLPTTQSGGGSSPGLEPPISNALMAALKRAQAHQRRGCPEQQQQPLLAVKVELEQLIISILDDPSVSRVMREASFSSPAVKATIEQSVSSAAPGARVNPAPMALGFCPTVQSAPQNMYLNPRLQQAGTAVAPATPGAQATQQRSEDMKRVLEILSRPRKKNPVLVGELEPTAVVRELVKRIEEGKELGNDGGLLKNVLVISLEREFGTDKPKINELENLVDTKIGGGGIILDFGDLKWLVEQPSTATGVVSPQHVVSSVAARATVAEVGRLLGRFVERLWLIGTASCETYLRCQVYHPSMENDWDLQAVPVAARSTPLPGLFPRLGTTGIITNSSVESLSPLKNLSPSMRHLSENSDPSATKSSCCPTCSHAYEQELAKLVASEKPTPQVKSEVARPPLPAWLQNAKIHPPLHLQSKDEDQSLKQKTQELKKKWNETCLEAHPQFHQLRIGIGPERVLKPTPFSMTGLCNTNPLLPHNLEPKSFNPNSPLLKKISHGSEALQLKLNPVRNRPTIPPGSPVVGTDLVLGQAKDSEAQPQKEGFKDFFSFAKPDTDSFKKLLKALTDSAWWQKEAASALATIVNRSKLDTRGSRWILLAGPDRIGKKRMLHALSHHVCGSQPITISFGSRRDNELSFRGKTALDRIAEGVRRNPFSIIMLEGVDEADILVRGGIRRAMERGRISDTHGREISLGNVTFILTVNWMPDHVKVTSKETSFDEEKLTNLVRVGWNLKLSVSEKTTTKRRASWLQGGSVPVRLRKDTSLSFDLNEAADFADDRTDGSRNSSDLTIDHEFDHDRVSSNSAVYRELLSDVEDSVIFKPLDFDALQEQVASSITVKFASFVGDHRVSLQVEEEALEKISSGLWLSGTGLDPWMETALIPSFDRLRAHLSSTESDESTTVVRLECGGYSDTQTQGECLPTRVEVAVDGS